MSRLSPRGIATIATVLCVLASIAGSGCAPADDVEILLGDLEHQDLEVRQDAALKLDRYILEGNYRIFLRGLESPNRLVRAESIVLLSRIDQPEARRELRELLRLEQRTMLPYNPIRLKPSSEETDSRILVAHLMARAGKDPEAIEVLIADVDDGQPVDVLRGTSLAVGVLGDPAGIAFLSRTTRHPDRAVVRAAAQALGQFAEPEALEALKPLATHPALEVRGDVLSSLTLRGGDGAIALMESIGAADTAAELRTAAIQARSLAGGAGLVPYLIERLEDADEGVRQSVQGVLMMQTGQSLGPRAEPWRQWWAGNKDARAAAH